MARSVKVNGAVVCRSPQTLGVRSAGESCLHGRRDAERTRRFCSSLARYRSYVRGGSLQAACRWHRQGCGRDAGHRRAIRHGTRFDGRNGRRRYKPSSLCHRVCFQSPRLHSWHGNRTCSRDRQQFLSRESAARSPFGSRYGPPHHHWLFPKGNSRNLAVHNTRRT